MDWKEIGAKVAKIGASLLGGALGGPGGAAIGSMVASLFGVENDPAAIYQAVQSDPQAAIKLRGLELKHKERLEELQVDRARIDTEERLGTIRQINETMRAESESEHWVQYSWRPVNGFAFAAAILLIYFVLPLAGKTPPTVPQWIWIGWGAILGVTTWDRGKEKRAASGGNSPGMIQSAITAIRGG